VAIGINPVGVAYDSAKGEIFVANSYWTRDGHGSVSIISDRNNQVIATVPVGEDPFYPAYGSGKGEVLVPNEGNGSVSVISDKNNTVISNVVLPGRVEQPWALTYDSAKDIIFCTSGNVDTDGTVFVISDSNKNVIANLTQPPVPTGLHVYYSSPLDIFPVYLDKHPSDAYTAEGYAGAGPHGIVYDSSKGTIFIVNNNAGNVSMISDAFLPSPPASPNESSTPSPFVQEFSPKILVSIAAIIIIGIAIFVVWEKDRKK
jgi:YVTN family beta-propeller protein